MMSRKPRVWNCSYFRDAEGLKEIDTISLGEVWAGTEGVTDIYVRNDDVGAVRDLKWSVDEPNVKISGPKEMLMKEIVKLTLKWTPGVNAEVGLKGQIRVSGIIVIQ